MKASTSGARIMEGCHSAPIVRTGTFPGSVHFRSAGLSGPVVAQSGNSDTPRTMRAHTLLRRAERAQEEDTEAGVFQNPATSRPWHDERSQRDHYWKPALKHLGIRWRHAYNTRHTYATVALMAGVPPACIASQLGNSVKMLLDRYARWIPGGDQGNARELLVAAMAPDAEGIRPRFVPTGHSRGRP